MTGLLVGGGDQAVERFEIESERCRLACFQCRVGRAGRCPLGLERQFGERRQKDLSRPSSRSASRAPAGGRRLGPDRDQAPEPVQAPGAAAAVMPVTSATISRRASSSSIPKAPSTVQPRARASALTLSSGEVANTSILWGSRDVDRLTRRRDTIAHAARHSRSIVHSSPRASSDSRVTASRNRIVNPWASSNSPGFSASLPVSGASGWRVMPRS